MPKIALAQPLNIDVAKLASYFPSFSHYRSCVEDIDEIKSEYILNNKDGRKVFHFYGKTKDGFTTLETDYSNTELFFLCAQLPKEMSDTLKQGIGAIIDISSLSVEEIRKHIEMMPKLYEEEELFEIGLARKHFTPLYSFVPLYGADNKAMNLANWCGVRAEDTVLPDFLRNTKVLDVGAGQGVVTERMRDECGADVFALEPCIEYEEGYDVCVKRLGEDRVYKLTAQEAIEKHPEIFEGAFDVVTVFKYNVDSVEREKFIKALALLVKPQGLVYITSVERCRLFFEANSGERPFITEMLEQYFNNVYIAKLQSNEYDHPYSYGAVTCSGPKLELLQKPKVSSPSS